MELETVIADIADGIDANETAGVAAGATADAGNEKVVARKLTKDLLGCRGYLGELGPVDDRSKCAVDIENDRGLCRSLT